MTILSTSGAQNISIISITTRQSVLLVLLVIILAIILLLNVISGSSRIILHHYIVRLYRYFIVLWGCGLMMVLIDLEA